MGTVTDSTGAVVPGAKVTVSNPERGFVREVASNSSGEYTAARIPIGNYVVTAEASGFEKLVRSAFMPKTIPLNATARAACDALLGGGTRARRCSLLLADRC